MASKSVEQRVMIAARKGVGLRLTPEDVYRLAQFHFIYMAALKDDERDEAAAKEQG